MNLTTFIKTPTLALLAAVSAFAFSSCNQSDSPSITKDNKKEPGAEAPSVASASFAYKTATKNMLTRYKLSTDKEKCLLNIKMLQKSMRGISNIEYIEVGEAFDANTLKQIYGKMPSCPTDGSQYIYKTSIPKEGESLATCPNCDSLGHKPANTKNW